MISKLEENLGDTDIKNFTVSPLYQIKCIPWLIIYGFHGIFRLKVWWGLGAVLVVSGQQVHDEGEKDDVGKYLRSKNYQND